MAWAAITEADLKTRISGVELEVFRAAVLADGQADPVADTILQVVDEVRGHIAACARNTLGPDGTVPSKLRGATVSKIILEIMARAGGQIIDPEGKRQDAADKAEDLLKRVADCKFVVEEPEEQTEETLPSQTPTISARDKEFSRSKQDGI